MEPTTIGQESTPSTPEESKAPTPEERSEAQHNWFNDRIRGVRGIVSAVTRGAQDQPAAKAEDDESTDASAAAESTPTAAASDTAKPSPKGDWAPPADAEDERKRYQSLRDQERAREQAASLQTRQQEQAAQIRELEAKRSELLKDEPWRVGEQVADIDLKIEAIKAGNTEQVREQELVGGVMAFYDAIYSDRFLQELPPEEVTRILARPYHGAEGRQMLAEETLSALTKHFKSVGAKEERAKLEKSQSYRKQLSQEFGLSREEPDQTPAVAGSAQGPVDMNSFIRTAAGRR